MATPIHTFDVPRKSGYIEKIDKKCFFQITVYPDMIEVVQRGGPIEPVALRIKGENLSVDDDWNWGNG
jgi:hypothetical protein